MWITTPDMCLINGKAICAVRHGEDPDDPDKHCIDALLISGDHVRIAHGLTFSELSDLHPKLRLAIMDDEDFDAGSEVESIRKSARTTRKVGF